MADGRGPGAPGPRWTAGRVCVRRYFRGRYVLMAQATRHVADTRHGRLLWLPRGADIATRRHPDGSTMREVPVELIGAAPLNVASWKHTDVLMLVRPGRAHSVWWFFGDAGFAGWYVNLERPARPWTAGAVQGLDTVDHALDLLVSPDGTSEWKDMADFEWAIDRPTFWSSAESRRILAEGRRLRRDAAAGRFPFDGTWCDVRVDAPGPTALPGAIWRCRPPVWTPVAGDRAA